MDPKSHTPLNSFRREGNLHPPTPNPPKMPEACLFILYIFSIRILTSPPGGVHPHTPPLLHLPRVIDPLCLITVTRIDSSSFSLSSFSLSSFHPEFKQLHPNTPFLIHLPRVIDPLSMIAVMMIDFPWVLSLPLPSPSLSLSSTYLERLRLVAGSLL